MSYVPYATPADYEQYGSEDIPADELEKALRRASRQIDSLTYNRIIGRGFSNMTEYIIAFRKSNSFISSTSTTSTSSGF